MNLKEGDTIGVISQSFCGPEIFPHIYEKGLDNLKQMGFTIKEFPFTRVQGTHKERAKDLMDAFLDPDVAAIICSIGGDDCTFLLEHLDLDLLAQHKKPIMGYSDPTALFAVFSRKGVPCYYGPSIMAGFSHMHLYPEWLSYTKKYVRGETLPFTPFAEYNESYVDWSTGVVDITERKKNEGFIFLHDGTATGKLFGGCIDVLEFIKGTKYWPEPEFFDDKILFFETSEDKPPVQQVKCFLRNYGFMGVLQRVKGILFGRARDYTDEEKKELGEMVLKVLKECNVSIPVVMNVDFGHTNPQLILQYGETVTIGNGEIKRT
ncbi:MAG: S66 family peptidase [Candidatus Woesearchaeota archaeon]